MKQFNILLFLFSNALYCIKNQQISESKQVQHLQEENKCDEKFWMKQGETYAQYNSYSYFQQNDIEQPMIEVEQLFQYSNYTIVDIVLFFKDENYQICSLENNKEAQLIRCTFQFLDYYIDNYLKFIKVEKEFILLNLNDLLCYQIIYFQKEILVACSSGERIELIETFNLHTRFKYYYLEDQSNCKIQIKQFNESNILIFLIDCQNWGVIFLTKQIKIKYIIDKSSVSQELGKSFLDENDTLFFVQICQKSIFMSFSQKTVKLMFHDHDRLKLYSMKEISSRIYPFINNQLNLKCQEERFLQYYENVNSNELINLKIDCQTNVLIENSNQVFILDERLNLIIKNQNIQLVRTGNFNQDFYFQIQKIFFFYDSRYLFGINNQNQLLIFKVQPFQFHYHIHKSGLITQQTLRFCNVIKTRKICISSSFPNNNETQINQSLKVNFTIPLFIQQSDFEIPKNIITDNILPLNKCSFEKIIGSPIETFSEIKSILNVCSFVNNPQLYNQYFNLFFFDKGSYLIYQGQNNSVIFFNCQTSFMTEFRIDAKLLKRMIESQSHGQVAIVSKNKFFMFQVDQNNVQLTLIHQFTSDVLQFQLQFRLVIFLFRNYIEQLALTLDGRGFDGKLIELHSFVEAIFSQNHYILQEQSSIDFRDGNFKLLLRINIEVVIAKVDFLRTNTDKIMAKLILINKFENSMKNYLYNGYELIYLNDFSLLHYTLERPLVYAERRQYFAVGVFDNKTLTKFVIIYNIRQTSLISVETIIEVKEFFFGFSSDFSFYYISPQRSIEIFNLKSFFITFNLYNFELITQSSQITFNCSSYFFPQLMKQVILTINIQNMIHQLKQKQNSSNSLLVSDYKLIDFDIQHYILGPIAKISLNDTYKFQLINPITMTLINKTCFIFRNGFCITLNRELLVFNNQRNDLLHVFEESYCILQSDLLDGILDIFAIKNNQNIILINLDAIFKLNIRLFYCKNGSTQIIQQFLEDFDPSEINLLKFKFQQGLLSLVKQYPTPVYCSFFVLVGDERLTLYKQFEFNDFAFLRNHPQKNQFIFLKYENEKFIITVQELNSIIIKSYQLSLQSVIEGELVSFKIQQAFYNITKNYYQVLLEVNINNLFFSILELILHHSLNITFVKQIRNPQLKGSSRLDYLNNNFYILTADSQQYLYHLTSNLEYYDYIYQLPDTCFEITNYNNSHSICSTQQDSQNMKIYFLEPHQYQIVLQEEEILENQIMVNFQIENYINKISFDLVLIFEDFGIVKENRLFFIHYSLLFIIAIPMIFCFSLFWNRRNLRQAYLNQRT